MKSALSAVVASLLLLMTAPVSAAPGDAAVGPQGAQQSVAAIEKAAQLIQTAQSLGDAAARTQPLSEAKQLLDGFIRDNPTHAELAQAELFLGLLLTVQGKTELAVAAAQADAAQQTALAEQARKTFREAERAYSSSTDRYTARFEAIPAFVEPGSAEHRRKEALKGSVIQVRMQHAGVTEELAGTYPEGNAQGREYYQAAADRYESIYRDFRLLIAGLMARVKQGQCYYHLGDTKRALGLYSDLLDQPSDLEPLRKLRISAMYLSLESWISPQEKLYELAVSQGEQFLLEQRPDEKAWVEWQGVRYYTARGYLLAVAGLPAAKTAERAEYLTHARGHAAALAEMPGPYQAAARGLVTQVEAAGAAKAP